MSWRIAADAREIFVDLVASSEKEAYFVRTLNRRDQLLTGLSEALAQLPPAATESIKNGTAHLWMTSDLSRVSLREHWGADCALITTEGFENLLSLGTGQRKNLFGLSAERSTPFISKDFSFGVTERTLKDGTIAKPLDFTEIENIISKLELSNVKNVAICFLNSKKNPQNEKDLAKFLKDKGYGVFCSHLENGNELARTEKAASKAFLATTESEFLEKIKNIGFLPENIFLSSERPKFKKPSPQGALYVEFFEDRILIKNENVFKELEISPLSLVELDEGGLVHIGPNFVDSEPGPVCMGKGLQLTAFDLLVLKSKLTSSEIPRLKLDATKVLRQLSPLAQNLRVDVETCIDKCINLFMEAIALEIEGVVRTPAPFMVVGGWLGSSLAPTLARRLGVKKVFIPPHVGWLSALQLLESDLKSNIEVKKIGALSAELPGFLAEGEIYDL
jgi:N-methylhydantoinase A/oxoprolinase/acetone carboxylase beta subunit